MIIGIDGRVLQEGSGGIFVYAKNLLQRMVPLAKEHKIKLFLNKRKSGKFKIIEDLARNKNLEIYQYTIPNKFLNVSFKFAKWPSIENLIHGCDVLFFPSIMYGAFAKKAKTVLTMHDVSYEFFPECFTLRQRIWHSMIDPKKLCERSSKIIAVSESTKMDVSEIYGIDKNKIKTIYSGIDSKFRSISDEYYLGYVKNKYSLDNSNYILQTSTLEPRKNHIATIDAFCKWSLENPTESKNWRLLIVGHKGWKSKNLFRAIRSSMMEDRIKVITDVSENDLPALYSMSSIFIYPSLYEGFGFPPLEALSCGVSVIASANSSLTEIVSDAGILVNPNRIDEIILAIHSLVTDKELVKDLRERGLSRAHDFTWERTAQETLKYLISD